MKTIYQLSRFSKSSLSSFSHSLSSSRLQSSSRLLVTNTLNNRDRSYFSSLLNNKAKKLDRTDDNHHNYNNGVYRDRGEKSLTNKKFQSSSRQFHSSNRIDHGGKGRPKPGTGIKIFFKNHKGELIREVEGNEGDDIVDLSWEWDLDIEAACEKSVACSTCHCIFEQDVYDRLPEPSEDEEDMLDLAFGLTDTSRLGCQVQLTKDMDGTTITLPSATRNLRVDGSKPSH